MSGGGGSSATPMNALLKSIQAGKKLKPVRPQDAPTAAGPSGATPSAPNGLAPGGMMAQLQAALAAKGLKEAYRGDDDNDDWDDDE